MSYQVAGSFISSSVQIGTGVVAASNIASGVIGSVTKPAEYPDVATVDPVIVDSAEENVNGSIFFTRKVVVAATQIVNYITIKAGAGGPTASCRVAIYGSTGADPGALIVESASVVIVAASTTQNIPIVETTLVAGTYWLAVQYSTATPQSRYEAVADGVGRHKNQAYGVFPDPAGATTNNQRAHYLKGVRYHKHTI